MAEPWEPTTRTRRAGRTEPRETGHGAGAGERSGPEPQRTSGEVPSPPPCGMPGASGMPAWAVHAGRRQAGAVAADG